MKKKKIIIAGRGLSPGKMNILHQSTGAAVVCNKKRNPVSPWFPGPQSCILTHLLHSTTGNEITRSTRVCRCRAGQGGCRTAAPTTEPAPPALPWSPVPLARWTKPGAAWARLSFWFVRCCPLPFPLDFSVCCNSPGKFWSEALILFGLLGLRLRAGNSTLLLKAFFHLPCKTRQSPCILHIRTGQAFTAWCGNASLDFSPLSTSSSGIQGLGLSV